jgi:peptidoglycan/xylan/chitin deacetylase (PgdA/CDA1 family)
MKLASKNSIVRLTQLVIIGVMVSSCSPGFKIDESVKLAIKENHEATDYASWSVSANHPEVLFETLEEEIKNGRDATAVSVELCQALESLSDHALLLFEPQIFETRNELILKPCLSNLKLKLERRHQQTRQEFRNQGMAVLDDVLLPIQEPETISETVKANQRKEALMEAQSTKARISFKIVSRDLAKGSTYIDGDLPPKHVILTFDDGPNSHSTPIIARTLEYYGVRAHFFMLASQVQSYPFVAKQIANNGHGIANHSVSHPCMGSVTECKKVRRVDFNGGVREIVSAHQIIFDIVGAIDPLYRFPYGASTPELRHFLRVNQTTEFFWNVDSGDWKNNQTNQDVLNRTMAMLNREKRGILLFHDIHRRTAEMLPELLTRLARDNYTIVMIVPKDESMRYKHPFLNKSYRP